VINLRTILNKKKSHGSSLHVNRAEYLDGYRLRISFNDSKSQNCDFGNFLNDQTTGYLEKYRQIENFKKFKIDNGNVVWGKNWDQIFPVDQLYNGHIQ
jgi:hypothetical protein